MGAFSVLFMWPDAFSRATGTLFCTYHSQGFLFCVLVVVLFPSLHVFWKNPALLSVFSLPHLVLLLVSVSFSSFFTTFAVFFDGPYLPVPLGFFSGHIQQSTFGGPLSMS